jgi:hypothetical protein
LHAYSQTINAREAKVLVVVAYFPPEKQIENAITVAHLLGGSKKFRIVGSLALANHPSYFKMLQNMIYRDHGLTQTATLTPTTGFASIAVETERIGGVTSVTYK